MILEDDDATDRMECISELSLCGSGRWARVYVDKGGGYHLEIGRVDTAISRLFDSSCFMDGRHTPSLEVVSRAVAWVWKGTKPLPES